MKISINSHSSIQVNDMFFDPFQIDEKPVKIYDSTLGKILSETKNLTTEGKAKYVFLTHTHYDHLSPEDLSKIVDEGTVFIAPPDAKQTLDEQFPENEKFLIRPNEAMELDGILVSTFPSYNLNKNFHKKESGWVGFKVTTKDGTFAVVGDTDLTLELKNLSCDILFVPIGGTYTMTASEAAEAANIINPKIVIPMHYNSLVGNKKDEKEFLEKLDKDIKPVILID